MNPTPVRKIEDASDAAEPIPSAEALEEGADGTEYEETGITKPFDPTLINIRTQQMSLDVLFKRMSMGEVDLAPDFQRAEVWRPAAKSRLIESLLIRIPLPAFYMDATDDDRWLVVDGLQRLATLRDFAIKKSMKLVSLEFLTQFNGCKYDELPRTYRRRIEETQVTVYLIEKGTPPEVKFNIFKRINTGGLPLTAQEIRHALNQGPVTKFLKEVACSSEFQQATSRSISDARMAARECVLRFFAFTLTDYTKYNAADFDAFLSDAMAKLNAASSAQRTDLALRMKRAAAFAHMLFGNGAFRKPTVKNRQPVNKALLEVWTVSLDQLSDAQLRELLLQKAKLVIANENMMKLDPEFLNAISQGTGDVSKVRIRFGRVAQLVREVLS